MSVDAGFSICAPDPNPGLFGYDALKVCCNVRKSAAGALDAAVKTLPSLYA